MNNGKSTYRVWFGSKLTHQTPWVFSDLFEIARELDTDRYPIREVYRLHRGVYRPITAASFHRLVRMVDALRTRSDFTRRTDVV